MDSKIYLHGICANEINTYDSYNTLRILKKILRSRHLLSLRLQKQFIGYGFNGIDYISLCDYEKRNCAYQEDSLYNSYYSYIRHSLSFAFPKNSLEVIEPIILDEKCVSSKKGYIKMADLGSSKKERYSDYRDEVQVKDRIDISKTCGLTFPTWSFKGKGLSLNYEIDRILYELDMINQMIDSYNYTFPIYDIDTLERLDSSSSIRRVLEYKENK